MSNSWMRVELIDGQVWVEVYDGAATKCKYIFGSADEFVTWLRPKIVSGSFEAPS